MANKVNRVNKKYGFNYDEMLDRIAWNLRTLRYETGLTVRDVAEEVGTGSQNVSSWESGYVIPSVKNLYILSRIYNVSMDDLCTKILS